jgi:aldehyde dehydrogenase family 7 protein A1
MNRLSKIFLKNNIRSFSSNRPIIKGTHPGLYDGSWKEGSGYLIKSRNPYTNEENGSIKTGTIQDYRNIIRQMDIAKKDWMNKPMPQRGEIVRQIGEALRENKEMLANIITLEAGKIKTEALGEVQEAIDICDYAVGLSRMNTGSIVPSERTDYELMERYNPLKKHVGVITAFNFPCAVFFWNTALNLVCGNTQIWKGSEITPLTSIACNKIVSNILEKNNIPGAVSSLIVGEGIIGEAMSNDTDIELLSFTGSTKVGNSVNINVAKRFGRSILELGGNAASIVTKHARMNPALDAITFAAVGTTGQRCTTTRRIYVQEDIYDEFLEKLISRYSKIKIGDPTNDKTLMGPLINRNAIDSYRKTILKIKAYTPDYGVKIEYGGNVLDNNCVEPTIISCPHDCELAKHEVFVPIVYIMKYKNLQEAIDLNNNVEQGLGSSIFSDNLNEVSEWLGPNGSDCGVVNVNTSTSGAEIGLAFGGNKSTGWGRHAGSDSWKQYMRRASVAMNYSNSDKVELAQGVSFSEDNTVEDNTIEENTIKYNIIENKSQFKHKFNSPH